MLFVFPGVTYMTTFPPLFQPWPTAGKYHSTLFPTKPLSVSLPAGACVMSIAGSDPIDQPSTRVHIPSAGWKHWAYGWPRDSNPGPLRRKLSALPLWAIQTTTKRPKDQKRANFPNLGARNLTVTFFFFWKGPLNARKRPTQSLLQHYFINLGSWTTDTILIF